MTEKFENRRVVGERGIEGKKKVKKVRKRIRNLGSYSPASKEPTGLGKQRLC